MSFFPIQVSSFFFLFRLGGLEWDIGNVVNLEDLKVERKEEYLVEWDIDWCMMMDFLLTDWFW